MSKLVAPKVTPSDEQIEMVCFAAGDMLHAELLATMEEDGTMRLTIKEDGLTISAVFDRKGQIIGDWH